MIKSMYQVLQRLDKRRLAFLLQLENKLLNDLYLDCC